MELNVLVLGMPNVGKSTLLNMLRHAGIKGRKGYFSRVYFIFHRLHFSSAGQSLPDISKSWADTKSVH